MATAGACTCSQQGEDTTPFIFIGSEELFVNQNPEIANYSRDWSGQTSATLEHQLRSLAKSWTARHPNKEFPGRVMFCAREKTEFMRLRVGLATCYSAGYKNVTLGLVKKTVGEPDEDKTIRAQDCHPLKLLSAKVPMGTRHLEVILSEEGYTLSHDTGEKDFPVERLVVPLENRRHDLKRLRTRMTEWRKRDRTVTVAVEDDLPFSEVISVVDQCRAMKYERIEICAIGGPTRTCYPFREEDASQAADRKPATKK